MIFFYKERKLVLMLQYHHEEQLDFLLKVLFLWILFPRVSHYTINTVLNRKFKHQYYLYLFQVLYILLLTEESS